MATEYTTSFTAFEITRRAFKYDKGVKGDEIDELRWHYFPITSSTSETLIQQIKDELSVKFTSLTVVDGKYTFYLTNINYEENAKALVEYSFYISKTVYSDCHEEFSHLVVRSDV